MVKDKHLLAKAMAAYGLGVLAGYITVFLGDSIGITFITFATVSLSFFKIVKNL